MTDPMDMGPLLYLFCEVVLFIGCSAGWDSVPLELVVLAEAMLTGKSRLVPRPHSKTGNGLREAWPARNSIVGAKVWQLKAIRHLCFL